MPMIEAIGLSHFVVGTAVCLGLPRQRCSKENVYFFLLLDCCLFFVRRKAVFFERRITRTHGLGSIPLEHPQLPPLFLWHVPLCLVFSLPASLPLYPILS